MEKLIELKKEDIVDRFFAFDNEYVVLNSELVGKDDDLVLICKVNEESLEELSEDEYIKVLKKYREMQDLFSDATEE